MDLLDGGFAENADMLADMLIASMFLLWIVVILLVVAMVALTRQVRLLRAEHGPAMPAPVDGRRASGGTAPVISAPTLAGGMLTIGGASADGRSLLLLFIRADCAASGGIVRDALTLCDRARLRLLFLGEGRGEDYADLLRRHRIRDTDFILNADVGADFRVGDRPAAALIDGRGWLLAQAMVKTRDQLEMLLSIVQPQPQPQMEDQF